MVDGRWPSTTVKIPYNCFSTFYSSKVIIGRFCRTCFSISLSPPISAFNSLSDTNSKACIIFFAAKPGRYLGANEATYQYFSCFIVYVRASQAVYPVPYPKFIPGCIDKYPFSCAFLSRSYVQLHLPGVSFFVNVLPSVFSSLSWCGDCTTRRQTTWCTCRTRRSWTPTLMGTRVDLRVPSARCTWSKAGRDIV